ncbi:hypothetical protein AXF42_Ash010984 [Apostasia shenzhenica]|uniref:Senescence regulator n=1 Tax=Apostasia shenzhenica TaxID=1088818 RepID=A0A2H9ZQS3_9ASPA|nr:hypothetical protein AXF42_Ash010984 [Apostasia shenzhenica]
MGRKVLSSERLLGVDVAAGGSVSGSDLSELVEEDVWTAGGAARPSSTPSSSSSSFSCGGRGSRLSAGGLEHRRRHVGGLSLAFESGYEASGAHGCCRTTAEVAASAPVVVPWWGRMGSDRGGTVSTAGGFSREEEWRPPEVASAAAAEEEEWMPPHEYLARAHGKTTVETSVFEGAGRTLKGRDLSRVRDAVWSRTGFFG